MTSLLDTDIVSQTEKAQPDLAVVSWWQRQDPAELALSAVVFHELRYGIELLPRGKRRREMEAWLRSISVAFQGRILAVDEEIADLAGKMLAVAKQAGHTASVGDVFIAATAKIHGLKVATLNRKHFQFLGAEIVDF